MRIERLDIDGYGCLSGTFTFPATGLGLWCAPNDGGKSSLAPALTAALYGPPPAGHPEPETGWIMVRLTRDDKSALVVARDLTAGTVQVTDASGRDVTVNYQNGSDECAVGERILGLTREEFRVLVTSGLEALRETVGNPIFRSLLGHGRGHVGGPGTPEVHAPIPSDPPDAETPPEPGEGDDLQIFRSAAEEMGYVEPPPTDPDATFVDAPSPGATLDVDPPPTPELVALEDLPEPPDLVALDNEPDASVRLRRVKEGLDTLDQRFEATQAEYRRFGSRLQDLRAESERLGSLSGAEPQDLQKLDQLLAVMRKIQDRREKLRIDDSRFRRELEQRGIKTDEIEQTDALFRALTAEDATFLEGYRQFETLLRGNQALIRSESRLDDTRLNEIDRARKDASRMAAAPLGVSILGLCGSILVHLIPSLPLPPSLFLALGLLGAGAGGYLLWRAKNLRAHERSRLVLTQERKRVQMEEFTKEEGHAAGRLSKLAEEHSFEPSIRIVDGYEAWRERASEIRQLHGFSKQADEIDRELVSVREKLGSFAPTEGPEMDPEELGAMLTDYRRFFEVQEELLVAEPRTGEFEEQLADLERERAAFRDRIRDTLEAAGIDPDRNLEEAIEIHARRVADGTIPESAPEPEAVEGAEPAAGTQASLEIPVEAESGPGIDVAADEPELAPAPIAAAPEAAVGASPEPATEAPRGVGLGVDRPGSFDWVAAVSARAEEIARQLVPGLRELEVDTSLVPRVRFSESEPSLPWSDLLRRLSAAAVDQLCLALRLAIVETISSVGERVPVLLDDPLLRADDARHARAMQLFVEDAADRGQIVLLTAHEVRTRWFLHQHPQLKERVASLREVSSERSPVSSPSS